MAGQFANRRPVITPVFHELTGEFDRVPLDSADARRVRLVDGRQHVLQPVTEFVEQRFDFADRHQ